jgi:hypothetical protein
MGLETETQLVFICQIAQYEMAPFGELPVTTTEIVINDCFVASFIEDFIGMRTDVSGPTSYEYHVPSPLTHYALMQSPSPINVFDPIPTL